MRVQVHTDTVAPPLLTAPLDTRIVVANPSYNWNAWATFSDGRLETLVDLATGETFRFQDDRFNVTINGDTTVEPDESFSIKLSGEDEVTVAALVAALKSAGVEAGTSKS